MRDESQRLSASLVVPEGVADELDSVARRPVESAGVLLASVVPTEGGDTRLLVRGLRWVNEAGYLRRGVDHMTIASEGYVPYLGEAETLGAMAIWLHTHPGQGSSPEASRFDREVDRQIADLFRIRSGSSYYGMVIVAPRQERFEFTGYLQMDGGAQIPVARCWIVGDRLAMLRSFEGSAQVIDPAFDRNVRAFGGGIQGALGQLCVGVVGCGGTGSAVVEQLVRLGVREFRLFDPDRLSVSNVTRVYGSSPADVGRFKAEALANHVARIAPDSRVHISNSMITSESTARQLCDCDVVFGCTDDNAGRLVLSRLATYLLTPVFDCGVLISSGLDGRLTGIDGRVTTLVPGQACLVCRGRIDTARAAVELMTPGERQRREDEGYAPALARVEPAVVAYTTMVAAIAVSEMLERFVGYGPELRPSEVLLRCHEREISTNVQSPEPRHYCNPGSGKIGMGLTTPFLEQTWPD
jgi:molybdopterin/thiamine biosynthesis adenylyltransferase